MQVHLVVRPARQVRLSVMNARPDPSDHPKPPEPADGPDHTDVFGQPGSARDAPVDWIKQPPPYGDSKTPLSINDIVRRLIDEPLRTVLDGLKRASQVQMPPELDHVASDLTRTIRKTLPHGIDLGPTRETIEAFRQRFDEAVRRAYAPNWLDTDVDEAGLFRLADWGVATVWVPSGDLLEQLLSADDVDVCLALLEQHGQEIIEDCDVALRGVVLANELGPYQRRLLQAVDAHHVDLDDAGQATSAAVATALLQRVYGHRHLSEVKRSPFRAAPESVELWQLKIAVLVHAAGPAFRGGRDDLDDSELGHEFNRHDTLHRAADEAYTCRKAMTALILATGLLLEANQMITDGLLT